VREPLHIVNLRRQQQLADIAEHHVRLHIAGGIRRFFHHASK
jgi:hypothetical protein